MRQFVVKSEITMMGIGRLQIVGGAAHFLLDRSKSYEEQKENFPELLIDLSEQLPE